MKVAFFDRDGTIIEEYPDDKWTHITSPVFLPNSMQTLKSVQQKGYEIIVITNQYLINEGFITLEQYENITEKMLDELTKHNIKIYDIFYCPHSRNEGCNCIKPKTGMIKQALEKYPTIKIEQSFMVGDSKVDVELAVKMKMKGFGIGIGDSYQVKNIIQINEIKELINYI
jgi:D-glycero-D-manno-heptose 1,7-bisphosphate phosphatase